MLQVLRYILWETLTPAQVLKYFDFHVKLATLQNFKAEVRIL